MRTTKTLIWLDGWPDWSKSSLSVHAILFCHEVVYFSPQTAMRKKSSGHIPTTLLDNNIFNNIQWYCKWPRRSRLGLTWPRLSLPVYALKAHFALRGPNIKSKRQRHWNDRFYQKFIIKSLNLYKTFTRRTSNGIMDGFIRKVNQKVNLPGFAILKDRFLKTRPIKRFHICLKM